MEKVLVHYFSGTGNSLLAAKQLAEELIKDNCQLIFQAIEDGQGQVLHNDFELHLFFFPIYATSVPHIVRKYIRGLPDGKKAKAAIITTNGKISTKFRDGYQGWALHQARLCLYLKNYEVFFSETLDYPHNITSAFPPRKAEINREIISQATPRIRSIAKKIIAREKSHRSFFWPNIIWSLPFGLFYSLLGRRLIGKMFVADSSCNLCGFCQKKCPVNAIKITDEKISWNWNCEGCLRCINFCPKQAIQMSAVRFLVFSSVIFNILLGTLSFIIVLIALDWLIYRASRIPILKDLVNWGHSKFYGRYRAQQFESQFLDQDQ